MPAASPGSATVFEPADALEVLDSLEADCRRVRRNFMAFARELTAGLVRIQRYSADLEGMAKVWKQI